MPVVIFLTIILITLAVVLPKAVGSMTRIVQRENR